MGMGVGMPSTASPRSSWLLSGTAWKRSLPPLILDSFRRTRPTFDHTRAVSRCGCDWKLLRGAWVECVLGWLAASGADRPRTEAEGAEHRPTCPP